MTDPRQPSREHEGLLSERPLSDEEIEAILEREAQALPPEAHVPAQPVPLVQREPGEGKFGQWAVWLIIAFIVASLVQSLR